MKNVIFLLSIILFVSCKKEVQKEKVKATSVKETETVIKESNDAIQKEDSINAKADNSIFLGYYVGSFDALESKNDHKPSYSNRINISIDSINNEKIYGHSVVAGNLRSFKGVFDKVKFFANVSEPGDDKYDGVFSIYFFPGQNEIKGEWKANNQDLAVTKREYKLEKKEFAYNEGLNLDIVDGYSEESLSNIQYDDSRKLESIDTNIIGSLNASTQELTNTDIENLNKGELEVLRNLIYARHGYSFKNRKMRYFFDSKIDWYIPVSTDIRNQLTDLEKKNIDLIKRYEQHAERYYDYFGR